MIKNGGRNKFSIVFLTGALILFFPLISEACRFWVAVGPKIPKKQILDQLVYDEHSLKHLGSQYSDGWSIGYYDDGEEIVIRGDEAADYNEEFTEAVRYVANFEPEIVMGHLRKASSGCVEGVPNPHPFRIRYNNTDWLFGHNGGMRKEILIDLIGETYLKKHPPVVCSDHPPESWIDSELYFIFLMKTIEEYDDHVEQGLLVALQKLYKKLDEHERYLNFFMTNGEKVWAFRKGTSLFFKIDKKNQLNIITSTQPDPTDPGWQEFPEDHLSVLSRDKPIVFIPMPKI